MPAATHIGNHLATIDAALDIDENNDTDALTDGLLIIRYLFGLRGPSLIAGAIGLNANNGTAEGIEAKIQGLMP